MAYTDDEKKDAEVSKLLHDYLKHITTLSTGSILLVVTFMERLFRQPEWQFLIGIALIGFLASIVFSVVVMTINIDHMHQSTIEGVWGGVSLLGVWAGFILGIISLAVFALKNIY